ncbi:hypothetical protein [Flavobacterium sp. K5-23]|uniref:hypothetical protein n=1 Tax=Flavobacterium sp. K5-23 TaxID=2746225 RepID=UPI00200BBE00|nr:hypothetical protein [Flavobacterium sp. K5-23]UQD57114.1 hypothetical protein FLAK523_12225 [Flavobacterium sp. K5-23]
MKTGKLILITFICSFTFNCLAQTNYASKPDVIKENAQKTNQKLLKKTTKTYHVEENINMTFGGYTTNYVVSDKKLVNTNDLGPNNTRVVTLKIDEEVKEILSTPETITNTIKPVLVSNTINTEKIIIENIDLKVNLKQSNGYAYVNKIKTYEKVAEKGYKSIEIFKKISNDFYFNDQLDKAAKWYEELFAMTTDLGSEYYYRYAHSLKATGGNTEKAKAFMEKFNELSEKENK